MVKDESSQEVNVLLYSLPIFQWFMLIESEGRYEWQ